MRRRYAAMGLILIVLVLCALPVSKAESTAGGYDYSLESKLEAMYAEYERGKEYETAGNMAQARKSFSNVVKNYLDNSYGNYKDAAEFYHYAQGWLCFRDAQYIEAVEHFQRCSEKKFQDIVYYIKYIQGCEELDSGDLVNAEKDLKDAREYSYLSGMASEQLDVLWKLQKEQQDQQKAAAAQQAEEEERKRKDAELLTQRQAAVLRFRTSKQGSGEKAFIKITWNNQLELNDYFVTVSTCVDEVDLDDSAVKVWNDGAVVWQPNESGCALYRIHTEEAEASFSVSGLWQGTVYYIRVYDARRLAKYECNTVCMDKANTTEKYVGSPEDVNVRMFSVKKETYNQSVYDIDRGDYKGCSPAVTLFNSGAAKRVSDFAVLASEENLQENGYYLEIAKAIGKMDRNAFADKQVELYLHVDNCGTARLTGRWPAESIRFLPGSNADTMFTIYLGELFDQLRPIPAGVDWRIELVLGGETIFSSSGVTK